MVYELGIALARAWHRLQTQHGAISIITTTEGKVQVQLKDRRVFDSLQGTVAVSVYESNGTTWRQSLKTFGTVQYMLMEAIIE